MEDEVGAAAGVALGYVPESEHRRGLHLSEPRRGRRDVAGHRVRRLPGAGHRRRISASACDLFGAEAVSRLSGCLVVRLSGRYLAPDNPTTRSRIAPPMHRPSVSLVIPMYNEELNI